MVDLDLSIHRDSGWRLPPPPPAPHALRHTTLPLLDQLINPTHPIPHTQLGVFLGLVLIALFPATPEQCEPPTETQEGSAPDLQSAAALSPSQQGEEGRRRQQRRASVDGDDTGVDGARRGETVQAALADEGRWVRLFGGGWAKAMGITEGQVRDAVARARAEAAAGAGGAAAAGVGRRGKGGGAAAMDGASIALYCLCVCACLCVLLLRCGGRSTVDLKSDQSSLFIDQPAAVPLRHHRCRHGLRLLVRYARNDTKGPSQASAPHIPQPEPTNPSPQRAST